MTVFDGYFADPMVLATPVEFKGRSFAYVAYGTGDPAGSTAADNRVFEALVSNDLLSWKSTGRVLDRLSADLGNDYWAPEVAAADGAFWLYYSVGHGIGGHHIRVARSDSALGPFKDLGLNLTPGEVFAIDAHPFKDAHGRWYLFFARDVLDSPRPGTCIAVAPMKSMTEIGETVTALIPDADWQIYERQRRIHNRILDWHTLEGPAVVARHGRYWMTYSGGAWTGPGYAVSWAVADNPLGPWRHAPIGSAALLATSSELRGPGHNSLATAPDGEDVIAFHSWDEKGERRQLHINTISFELEGPRVDGPIRGLSTTPQD